eukprot:3622231-Prymnesium_polylepis.1
MSAWLRTNAHTVTLYHAGRTEEGNANLPVRANASLCTGVRCACALWPVRLCARGACFVANLPLCGRFPRRSLLVCAFVTCGLRPFSTTFIASSHAVSSVQFGRSVQQFADFRRLFGAVWAPLSPLAWLWPRLHTVHALRVCAHDGSCIAAHPTDEVREARGDGGP